MRCMRSSYFTSFSSTSYVALVETACGITFTSVRYKHKHPMHYIIDFATRLLAGLNKFLEYGSRLTGSTFARSVTRKIANYVCTYSFNSISNFCLLFVKMNSYNIWVAPQLASKFKSSSIIIPWKGEWHRNYFRKFCMPYEKYLCRWISRPRPVFSFLYKINSEELVTCQYNYKY